MSVNQPSAKRPAIIELIRAEASGYPDLIEKAKKAMEEEENLRFDPREINRVFTLFTGNRWMEVGGREPDPKMLFGEFWQQGELCLLFADTNAGKSVLAVQIGDSISRRRMIRPFKLQVKKDVVMYVDFELSGKQFYLRYNDGATDHEFSDNFYRAQFNLNNEMPTDPTRYDQYIMAAICDRIYQIKATVLIIDNITCMRRGTENTRVALMLMKELKLLQHSYNLSVLVLAHTPKRNPTKPITVDDLQGSKLLINFADSAFAIGKSKTQPGLSYLKQIKQRNAAEKYGSENVCLGHITKPGNFVKFEFKGNGRERDHLAQTSTRYREQLAQQIAGLAKKGLSQRRISQQLNIPLTTVNRFISSSAQKPLVIASRAPRGTEREATS